MKLKNHVWRFPFQGERKLRISAKMRKNGSTVLSLSSITHKFSNPKIDIQGGTMITI